MERLSTQNNVDKKSIGSQVAPSSHSESLSGGPQVLSDSRSSSTDSIGMPMRFQQVLAEWGYTTSEAQVAFVRVIFALGLESLTTEDSLINEAKARSGTLGEPLQVIPTGVCAEEGLAKALKEVYPAGASPTVEDCASYTEVELWPILDTVVYDKEGVRLWLVCGFQLRGLRPNFHKEASKTEGSGTARWEPVAKSLKYLTTLKALMVKTHILAPLGLLNGYAWPAAWPDERTAIVIHGGLEDVIARRVNALAHLVRYSEGEDAPKSWPVLYPSNPRGLFNEEASLPHLLGQWWWVEQKELLSKQEHTLESVIACIKSVLALPEYTGKEKNDHWLKKDRLIQLQAHIIRALGLPNDTPWPQKSGYAASIAHDEKHKSEWSVFQRAGYGHLVGWPTAFDAVARHVEQLQETLPLLKGRLNIIPLPICAILEEEHKIANTEDSLLIAAHWCKTQPSPIKQVIAITDNEHHQARYQAAQSEAVLGLWGIGVHTVALETQSWQWEMAMDNMAKTLYVQHTYGEEAGVEEVSSPSRQWRNRHRERVRHQVYSNLQDSPLSWSSESVAKKPKPSPKETVRSTLAGYEVIPLPAQTPAMAVLLAQFWQAYPNLHEMKDLLRRQLTTPAGEALSEAALNAAFIQGLSYRAMEPLCAWAHHLTQWPRVGEKLVQHPDFPKDRVLVIQQPTGYVQHWGSSNASHTLLLREDANGELAWLVEPSDLPSFVPCTSHVAPQLFPASATCGALASPSWVRLISLAQVKEQFLKALPLKVDDWEALQPLVKALHEAQQRGSSGSAGKILKVVEESLQTFAKSFSRGAAAQAVPSTTMRGSKKPVRGKKNEARSASLSEKVSAKESAPFDSDRALLVPALWYGVSQVLQYFDCLPQSQAALRKGIEALKELMKGTPEIQQTLMWGSLWVQYAQAAAVLRVEDEDVLSFELSCTGKMTPAMVARTRYQQAQHHERQGQLIEARSAYEQAYRMDPLMEYGLRLVGCLLEQGDYVAAEARLADLDKHIHSSEHRCLHFAYEDQLAYLWPQRRAYSADPSTEKARQLAFDAYQGEASVQLALARCSLLLALDQKARAERWLHRAHERYWFCAFGNDASSGNATHPSAWEAAFSGACAALAYGSDEFQTSYVASRLRDALRDAADARSEEALWPHSLLQTAQSAEALAMAPGKEAQLKSLAYLRALHHYGQRYACDIQILKSLSEEAQRSLDSSAHIALLDSWTGVAARGGWFRQAWMHYWEAARRWKSDPVVYRCLLLRLWRYQIHLPALLRAEVADELSQAYFPEDKRAEQCLPQALRYAQYAFDAYKTEIRSQRIKSLNTVMTVSQERWGQERYGEYMHALWLWYEAQEAMHDPQNGSEEGGLSRAHKNVTEAITHCGNLLDHCYGAVRHQALDVPKKHGGSFPQKANEAALNKRLEAQGVAVTKHFDGKTFFGWLDNMAKGCQQAWETACLNAFIEAGYIQLDGTKCVLSGKWKEDWRTHGKRNYVQRGLQDLRGTCLAADSLREILAERWMKKLNAPDARQKGGLLSANARPTLSFFYNACGAYPVLAENYKELGQLMQVFQKAGWIKMEKKRAKGKVVDLTTEYHFTDSFLAEVEGDPSCLPSLQRALLNISCANTKQEVLLNVYGELLMEQLYRHAGRGRVKEKIRAAIRAAQPYVEWQATIEGEGATGTGPWLDRLQAMHNQMKHVTVMPLHQERKVQRQYREGTLCVSQSKVMLSAVTPLVHSWHLALFLLNHRHRLRASAPITTVAEKLYSALGAGGFLKESAPSHEHGRRYVQAKAQGNKLTCRGEQSSFYRELKRCLNERDFPLDKNDCFVGLGPCKEWVEDLLGPWLLNRHLEYSGVAFKPEDLRCETNGFLSTVFCGVFQVLDDLCTLLPPVRQVASLAPTPVPVIPTKPPALPGNRGTYGEWRRFLHFHLKQLELTGEVKATPNWPRWCVAAYRGHARQCQDHRPLTGDITWKRNARGEAEMVFLTELEGNQSPEAPLAWSQVDGDIVFQCEEMEQIQQELQGMWVAHGPTEALRNRLMTHTIRWRHALEQTWTRLVKGTLGVALLAESSVSARVSYAPLLSPEKTFPLPCVDTPMQLWKKLRNQQVAAPTIQIIEASEAEQDKNHQQYANNFYQENVATLAYDHSTKTWSLWMEALEGAKCFKNRLEKQAGNKFNKFKVPPEELRLWSMDGLPKIAGGPYAGVTMPYGTEAQLMAAGSRGGALWVKKVREFGGYLPYSILDHANVRGVLIAAQPFSQPDLTRPHWHEWLQASSNESKHERAMELLAAIENRDLRDSLCARVRTQRISSWHLRGPLSKVLFGKGQQRFQQCSVVVLAKHLHGYLSEPKLVQAIRQGKLARIETLVKQLRDDYDGGAFRKLRYEGAGYLDALKACLRDNDFLSTLHHYLLAENAEYIFSVWPCFTSALQNLPQAVVGFFQVLRTHENHMADAWRWALSSTDSGPLPPMGAKLPLPEAHSGAYATLVSYLSPLAKDPATLDKAFEQLKTLLGADIKDPLGTPGAFDRWRLWLAAAKDSRCKNLLGEGDFSLLTPWLRAFSTYWKTSRMRGCLGLDEYKALWKELNIGAKVFTHPQEAQQNAQRFGECVISVSAAGVCTLWRPVDPLSLKQSSIAAFSTSTLSSEKVLDHIIHFSDQESPYWPSKLLEQQQWLRDLCQCFGYERGDEVRLQPLDAVLASYIEKLLEQERSNGLVWAILAPPLAYYYHQQRTGPQYQCAVEWCSKALALLEPLLEQSSENKDKEWQSLNLQAIATLYHHRGNARLNGLWSNADKEQQQNILKDLQKAFLLQWRWIASFWEDLEVALKETKGEKGKLTPFANLLRVLQSIDVPQVHKAAAKKAYFTLRTLGRACREYALSSTADAKEFFKRAYEALKLLNKGQAAQVFREDSHLWLLLCHDVVRLRKAYEESQIPWPSKVGGLPSSSEDVLVQLEEALSHIESLIEPEHYFHSRQTALLTLAEYYGNREEWQLMQHALERLAPLTNPEHQARRWELLGHQAKSQKDWSGARWYYARALAAQPAEGDKNVYQCKLEQDLARLPCSVHWRTEGLLEEQAVGAVSPAARRETAPRPRRFSFFSDLVSPSVHGKGSAVEAGDSPLPAPAATSASVTNS